MVRTRPDGSFGSMQTWHRLASDYLVDATNAAFRGNPGAIIWHFQLQP